MERPPYEVYVGEPSPSQHEQRVERDKARGVLAGGQGWIRHPLTDPDTWKRASLLRPMYPGIETSRCVAALNPVPDAEEMRRFRNGARQRTEPPLTVTEVRAHGFHLGRGEAIYRSALPSQPGIHLADELSALEADFANRVRSTHKDGAPWYALNQSGPDPLFWSMRPLLRDDLGNPVAAICQAKDTMELTYVIPPECNWPTLFQWLTDRAIPELIPTAARRAGLGAYVPDGFRTEAERQAEETLRQHRDDAAQKEKELESALARAREDADAIRLPLLEGRGHELKRVVARLFEHAGFGVEDLDETMGEGVSTDLLLSLNGKQWLVEVTSCAQEPKQTEVGSLLKHVKRWLHMKRDEKIEHGVLVVSSHLGEPPERRPDGPYTDKAFVASLEVGAVSTVLLFQWWLAGDLDESIRRAISDPPGQRSA